EKNYRAEKAKRRRGIGKAPGLVKPVRRVEKGRLAKAEPQRLKAAKELRKELPSERRELKNRVDTPRRSKAELKTGAKKIEAKSIRKPTPSKRSLTVTESKKKAKRIKTELKAPKKARRIKPEVKAPKEAKRIKPEVKAPKKIKKEAKSVRSEKASNAPQKITKSGSSKPKSSTARVTSSGKTAKPASGSKAPSAKTSGKSKTRRR
ncbi:MAG: hypothetical protein WBF13_08005, partial [Candidatus Zixiibacteriota bacterium]